MILQPLLRTLAEADVEAVVVGGVEAVVHGATYATVDLDVCDATTDANRQRIADALRPLGPSPRDVDRALLVELEALQALG